MERSKRAVITIVGIDRTNILAPSATEVAKVDGNIINVSQQVFEGLFTMSMVVEIENLKCSLDELQKAVAASVPDMVVHVMHEDIFNAMHTI